MRLCDELSIYDGKPSHGDGRPAPKGGGQGSTLTGPAFVLTADPALKLTESKSEGVNVRAVQDDVTMAGPPHVISGTDGALGALLDGLAEIGLKPQRTKFEALGTTKEALADKPEWLPVP